MKYALTGTHRSPLIWHVLRDDPVWLSLCYNGVQQDATRNDVPPTSGCASGVGGSWTPRGGEQPHAWR